MQEIQLPTLKAFRPGRPLTLTTHARAGAKRVPKPFYSASSFINGERPTTNVCLNFGQSRFVLSRCPSVDLASPLIPPGSWLGFLLNSRSRTVLAQPPMMSSLSASFYSCTSLFLSHSRGTFFYVSIFRPFFLTHSISLVFLFSSFSLLPLSLTLSFCMLLSLPLLRRFYSHDDRRE